MRVDRSTTYSDRVGEFVAKASALQSKVILLSTVRVIVLVAAIIVFFALLRISQPLSFGLSLALIAIFLILVKWHVRASRQLKITRSLLHMNQSELDVLKGQYGQFPDGSEFLDNAHPYALDLDLFGEGSLFQYLNRAATLGGKERLAEMLQTSSLDIKQAMQNQQAIAELAAKLDWRHQFKAISSLHDEEEAGRVGIAQWVESGEIDQRKPFRKIWAFGLPILAIGSLVLYAIGIIPGSLFTLAVVFSLIVVGTALKTTQSLQEKLDQFRQLMSMYSELLPEIINQDWTSDAMKQRVGSLLEEGKSASDSLSDLAKISGLFDKRSNPIMGIVLNAFLAWDFHCLIRLQSWREKHKEQVLAWMNIVHEIDALSSLSNLAYNFPHYQFPTYSEQPTLKAVNMGHPLVDQEECVGNDVSFSGFPEVHIVTGANMAGKSTYLRTVGVNYILAACGSPVCADSFECSAMQLYSSMRTSDSLQRHESYFHSELLRLQTIVRHLETETPTLVILDEILKGTNSKDKEAGSKMFVEKLLQRNCFVVIATHDLSLCTLQEKYPDQVLNYSFEIEMTDDKLKFDYKLRLGICSTMNATFLMKQMGIA